jgi:hypothetical protein
MCRKGTAELEKGFRAIEDCLDMPKKYSTINLWVTNVAVNFEANSFLSLLSLLVRGLLSHLPFHLFCELLHFRKKAGIESSCLFVCFVASPKDFIQSNPLVNIESHAKTLSNWYRITRLGWYMVSGAHESLPQKLFNDLMGLCCSFISARVQYGIANWRRNL